ncbi:MAG: tol-pal system protein YbgF [Candidatus Berkiellales bacterium]
MMLSLLLPAEIAWGLPSVESRSQSWQASEPVVGEDSAVSEAAAENPSMDVLRKMEYLEQEVQDLRGKVEEQTYQLQQMQEHQKKLYTDLDQRLRETTPSTVKKTSGSGVSAETPETQATTNLPKVPSPSASQGSKSLQKIATDEENNVEEKAYQKAYHLVQKKDYDAALLAFKSLIKSFPEGKYYPNAHFWLGEIYLAKSELDLAADAFGLVFGQFPDHPKAADALLKLGYVEYMKGQWDRSQELLSQVKTQFPGSTSAQLADSRLQQMHQEGHI